LLKPNEIEEREFAIRADGYDPDEVDRFVAEAAETIAALRAEAGGRSGSSDESGPMSFADVGRAAQRVLEAADESATEIISGAEAEADRVREEARDEATRLRDEARVDRERAARELEELEESQREHDEFQRHAREVIRTAGESTRQLLSEAAEPREGLVSSLEDARRLLMERFEEAETKAEVLGRRASEIAEELEVELPMDFRSGDAVVSDPAQDPRLDGLAPTDAGDDESADDEEDAKDAD
jgi:DivIVA domain-containing protein